MEEEDHFQLTHRLSQKSQRRIFVCTTTVLGCLLVTAVLVVVALGVLLGISLQKSTPSDSNDICLSSSCVDLAAFVQSTMNEDIDPCEDFYNFSCGGWEKRNVIPQDFGSNAVLYQLYERNQIALKKLLESGQDEGIDAIKKAIDAYSSCMDTEGIDAAGVQPLLDLIDSTGGWSLLTNSASHWADNIENSLLQEKLLSSAAFFSMDLVIDPRNSSKYLLINQQSGLTASNSTEYLDPLSTFPQQLKALIQLTLSKLAPTLDANALEQAASEVVQFETSLASIFEDADSTPSLETAGSLKLQWSYFDWFNFLSSLFRSAGVTLKSSEEVVVFNANYLTSLGSLLRDTPSRILENYAKWQLIIQYLLKVSSNAIPLGHIQGFLSTQELSSAASEERYQTCVDYVSLLLPMAVGRLFAEHVLPKNTKENTSALVDSIKVAFKERIDESDWLDFTSKQRSKEKVDAVTAFESYPDQLFDTTFLQNLYSEYQISPNDYFGNFVRGTKLKLLDGLKRLDHKVNKMKVMWISQSLPPTQVNAFYNPQVNSLVILEGISRPSAFHPEWPESVKYGALGSIISHEFVHGFDNNGIKFDKAGVYRQWWTEQSVAAFEERQQCLVDQYSQYEMFRYRVDGEVSLPENIADNGGIKVSFQAYKDYVKSHQGTANIKTLPALSKYTADQLYFISWGQLWCSLYTEEGFSEAAYQTHAPGPFRVVGSLVNFPEFAKAFNCPTGSEMNPEEKCFLW